MESGTGTRLKFPASCLFIRDKTRSFWKIVFENSAFKKEIPSVCLQFHLLWKSTAINHVIQRKNKDNHMIHSNVKVILFENKMRIEQQKVKEISGNLKNYRKHDMKINWKHTDTGQFQTHHSQGNCCHQISKLTDEGQLSFTKKHLIIKS